MFSSMHLRMILGALLRMILSLLTVTKRNILQKIDQKCIKMGEPGNLKRNDQSLEAVKIEPVNAKSLSDANKSKKMVRRKNKIYKKQT